MRDYNCELIGKVISVEENPDSVEFYMEIPRSSGRTDIIPVIVSRQVLGDIEVNNDMMIRVLGIVKTLKSKGVYKSRLRVEATDINIPNEGVKSKNTVFGRFEVKSTKGIRKTRSDSVVKDLTLKKNMSESLGYTEFRAILWNEDAEMYDNIDNGTELYIVGRLQSRDYIKKTDDGDKKVRTYEVSIGKVEDDTDKYAEDIK